MQDYLLDAPGRRRSEREGHGQVGRRVIQRCRNAVALHPGQDRQGTRLNCRPNVARGVPGATVEHARYVTGPATRRR